MDPPRALPVGLMILLSVLGTIVLDVVSRR
ncbi:MAG: hypothetical protein QOH15_489 [Gaiellales bacterium]|jgi:hypothetical protein|nr:hypothetical protein [Gaiellales bacterium]